MGWDALDSRVLAHLKRILSITAEGRAALGISEATQWRALALSRWQLLEALKKLGEGCETVMLQAVPPISAPDFCAFVMQLANANAQLLDEYQLFVQRWALASPASVTDQYSQEAQAMASRIEQQAQAQLQAVNGLAAATRAGDRPFPATRLAR